MLTGLRERNLDAINTVKRGGAAVARLPHKQEVVGAIPAPASTSHLADYAPHNED